MHHILLASEVVNNILIFIFINYIHILTLIIKPNIHPIHSDRISSTLANQYNIIILINRYSFDILVMLNYHFTRQLSNLSPIENIDIVLRIRKYYVVIAYYSVKLIYYFDVLAWRL